MDPIKHSPLIMLSSRKSCSHTPPCERMPPHRSRFHGPPWECILLSLLLLLLGTATHADDNPPPKKHPYSGILSVKPVEKESELEGNTLLVRELMPASGFLIGKNTILTAEHVQEQSPLALIHTLDETGQFSKKYAAYEADPFPEADDTYTMTLPSPENGQTIETDTLEYDVAQYTAQDPITDITPLTPFNGTVRPSLQVNVTGIVYKDKYYTTQTATGRINRIHRAKNGAHLLLLDIKSEHGMSGAPVTLPPTGEVIGVLMGEYRYPPYRYTVVWSLPKALAPNIKYQTTNAHSAERTR